MNFLSDGASPLLTRTVNNTHLTLVLYQLNRSVLERIVETMTPAYKLTYFNTEGITEPIRYLLSFGGIGFEDVRIANEDWPAIKPTTPFGTLPVLEYKGKKAGQSVAIARYVAKQVKLVGKDDWENLEIDAVVDTITDWRLKVQPYLMEQDKSKKNALKDQAMKDNTFYVERFEELAKTGNGHLALGRLTWADVFLAPFAIHMQLSPEKYPNLVALKNKVLAIPNIKRWVESHPKK